MGVQWGFMLLSFALIAALPLAPALHVRVLSPEAAAIPRGAQRVTMLEIRMTAACDADVPVRSITLFHEGRGASEDLTSVYLVREGRRVTRGRAFASPGEPLFFPLPRDFSVPACRTVALQALADFSAGAAVAGEHALAIRSPEGIDAGGTSVSLLSMTQPAGIRRTASGEAGSISVTFLPLIGRVRYGAQRTVARMSLTADGDSDQWLDAVMLTNDGSARGTDLQNLSLQTQRKTVLARAAALEGSVVCFILEEPLFIERGQTVRVDVRADVWASRRRTILFLLEEASDLASRRAMRRVRHGRLSSGPAPSILKYAPAPPPT